MSKWEVISFNDVIVDETKKAKKIKKDNYLPSGKYQIIDQGQELIAGYINDDDGVYTEVPAIIFGDHTRIIKYVDKPLYLGADGVKLLKIKKECFDYKFLYYYFVKNKIPNTGYNRHFKWLKELLIPVMPLDVQKHIADTLDKTQEIVDCHKKQLGELDNLIKAVFYDMFGDPATNEKGWKVAKIKDLAKKIQYGTSEKASSDKLKYPILRMNNITYTGNWDLSDLKYINIADKDKEKYLVHKGEMLFNRTNSKELVGKTAAYRNDYPMAYAGYLVKLTPNNNSNSEFVSAFLNSKYGKEVLFLMAKNIIGMANINAQELGSIKIYVPPIDLQNMYAQIVTKIEEQKAIVKQSIKESENLFNSLMSKYFD